MSRVRSLLRRVRRRLLKPRGAPQSHPGRPAGGGSTMRLRGYQFGMFANVHQVAEFARFAAADGRDFVMKWPNSPYLDPEHPGDPWLYFFEPVFEGATLGANPQSVRATYPDVPLSTEHLFHPRLLRGERDTMTIPTDRHAGHDVLERFIQPNRTTRAFIEDFAENFFTRPVIGLHLRGAGRVHGGALEMRAMVQPDGGVPYDLYFDAVDDALETHPDALVFTCSDSLDVIAQVRRRYGDRMLVYPASRSDFGEMHENHPENEGRVFSPYKLGLDVVVEAHLLAKSAHFVHGNSNVANYVLCRAPDMPSTYVYQHLEDRLVALQKAQDEA
jgi:hypothetical protein